MAERLIEILVPDDRAAAVEALLVRSEPRWSWRQSAQGQTVFKLLADSADVEELLDPLQPIVAGCESGRILVLAVEARFPARPEPPPAPDATQRAPWKASKRISREELYEDLRGFADPDRIYLTMVILSTVVAASGLTKDSAALLIGAMVIAPLLGPNMALTLATTLGDRQLGWRALKATGAGIATAAVLAAAYGLLWPFDIEGLEVGARVRVDLADVAIALATGVAAALSTTTAAVSTLVGVMVAAALLPPLIVTVALLVNGQFEPAASAFLLLATNVVCVNLAGIATFLVMGVRPRTWWEGDKAKRATRRAVVVWSVLLIAVVVLILRVAAG